MTNRLRRTPGQGLRIEVLYAYLAIDPNDNVEGVAAARTEMGWLPMVGADMEMMDKLRPAAEAIAAGGTKVTLALFTNREDQEVFE